MSTIDKSSSDACGVCGSGVASKKNKCTTCDQIMKDGACENNSRTTNPTSSIDTVSNGIRSMTINNDETTAKAGINCVCAFLELCVSDKLSITSLQKTINRPGLIPINNHQETLFAFHHVCHNKNVTMEIIELLLEHFPDSARVLCSEFATSVLKHKSISKTYPLHIACCNENCPSDVIRFLVEQYPSALGHLSNEVAGLPLHYYLARNSNVDINTVKTMVEAYPQSLMITSGEEDEEILYPIHALLSNEWTNNIHTITIVDYLLEFNPTCLRVRDGNGHTPLHVACQSKRVNLIIVERLFNSWPEAIRIIDDSGWLPVHDLCENSFIDDAVALEILQFMLDADPNLPRCQTEGGYLPIHYAVDEKSFAFCKVLIDAYPESVVMIGLNGHLPIHEARRLC